MPEAGLVPEANGSEREVSMSYYASPFGRDRRRKGNSRRAHRHRPDRRYAARRLRLESLEDRRLLAEIAWDGEAGTTDWHDEANWSTNTVPSPSDDVQLDAVAVHISEDLTVQSLALHGGSLNVAANATVAHFEFKGGTLTGSGTVTVNENFNWTGGIMAGEGTTVLTTTASGTISDDGDAWKLLGRTLDNFGTLILAEDTNHFAFGPTETEAGILNNHVDASLTFENNANLGVSHRVNLNHQLNNAGTLYKNGSGTSSTAGVALNNTGTVEFFEGRLISENSPFNDNPSVSSGTFAVNTIGVLEFRGGVHVVESGSYFGSGWLHFNAQRTTIEADIWSTHIQVSSGETLLQGETNTNQLVLDGGILQGDGTITVHSEFTWTAGTMAGSGATVTTAGAVGRISDYVDDHLSAKNLGRELENNGNLTIGEGTHWFWFGPNETEVGILNNRAGAMLTFENNAGIATNNWADLNHQLNNAGTIVKGGAGTTSTGGVALNNTGLVEVHHGRLVSSNNFYTPSTSTGTFAMSPGTELEFEGYAHTLTDSASIRGGHSIFFNAQEVSVAGKLNANSIVLGSELVSIERNFVVDSLWITRGVAVLNATVDVNTLTLEGSLIGDGAVSVNFNFTWTAGTMAGAGKTSLATSASGTIAGETRKILGRVLENGGKIEYTGSTLEFAPSPTEAGILDNLAGATFHVIGDGDLSEHYSNSRNVFNNFGTFRRTETTGLDATVVTIPFQNQHGSVELMSGSLEFLGSSQFNFSGASRFHVASSGQLGLHGSLAGPMTNTDLFEPRGTVTFHGRMDEGDPLLLEVMGRDLGPDLAGFQANAAYGVLNLQSADVRLVDESDNVPGPSPEALYVDTLSVPAGSTLDLNGIPLYARVVDVAGTVVGGSITQLADGGRLVLNTRAAGAIAVAGELDEWTFFGRAGRVVTVSIDPGQEGLTLPVAPHLGLVAVQLLDPVGEVLATVRSEELGQAARLLAIPLSRDGVYTIRVHAPDTHPGEVGNYLLSIFDATTTTRPLNLNARETGNIDNLYTVDRWTFLGRSGQSLRFDLINASSSSLVFQMTGPDGWIGFQDLADDSELLTLPADGEYTLAVSVSREATAAYAFRLDEFDPTTLTLGTSYRGSLLSSGQAELFQVPIDVTDPLVVVLDDSSAENRTEVYVRRGAPPTRREFHYHQSEVGADHIVTVPLATPGLWYVLVYGQSVAEPSDYTLQIASGLVVGELNPQQYGAVSAVEVAVSGAGFVPGINTSLVGSEGNIYAAEAIEINSFQRLTATFDLSVVPPGRYDLRVTLPSGQSRVLPNSFQVLPAGEALLATDIILPPALGRASPATLYVEYANTGVAVMEAPILTLASNDPDGSDRPLLTLDSTLVAQALWSDSLPPGVGTEVQIYASGKTPGLLQPGESVRVPVYYAGLQRPWDATDEDVEFVIHIHAAGSSAPRDASAWKASMRPSWIPADTWDAVFDNLTAQLGTTWGEYVSALSESAAYLDRLGLRVTSVDELYGFEFRQAVGLHPVSSLAAVTDFALPVPGPALTVRRYYDNNISDRYSVGPFGRGWSVSRQIELKEERHLEMHDGEPPWFEDVLDAVIVYDTGGSQRRFLPDARTSGRFFSQEGDLGKLTHISIDGTIEAARYELKEADGTVTRFYAQGALNGRLDFVKDSDGNRITAEYTAEPDPVLSRLTHSNGAWLEYSYNAAGLISQIADSSGQSVTYTYDPTFTYLLSATGPRGTSSYAYDTGAGLASEHALTSITDPSGVAQFFEYDDRGRLAASYRSGNAQRIDYTFDESGRVTATDAAGVTTDWFFDHRGFLVRRNDASGGYDQYEYDDAGRLLRESNALGGFRTYQWSRSGGLLSATDEHGNTTTITPKGPNLQPTSVTDARGNMVRYAYDAAGNLTRIVYPDGSVEQFTYDEAGNRTSRVNRRGETISAAYNSAGQITQITFPDGSTRAFTYDARGRAIVTTDDQGATTLEYDQANRLTRIEYPGGRWLEYSYDAAGRRTGLLDHDGLAVEYRYDEAGRLRELRDPAGAGSVMYSYDAAGRLSREEKGNGAYSEYIYDGAGRIDTISHYAQIGFLNSRFSYSYDATGRPLGVKTVDGDWTYEYDVAGQLVRAVLTSKNLLIPDQDLRYEYDAVGNRIRSTANEQVTDYATNALNQITTAGDTSYRYDRDGNLVEAIGPDGTRRYSFDVANRLTRVTTSQGVWSYDYDSLGNRSAVIADGQRTEYLIDPTGIVQSVAEYDAAGGRLATYVHGVTLAGIDGPYGWEYYDFDLLGSTVGVSDATGLYQNRYAYDPFGQSLLSAESVDNPFEFVGAFGVRSEPFGDYFMRARSYAPETGRFLSIDPLRVPGENAYHYAFNAPTYLIDPLGLYAAGGAPGGGSGGGGAGGGCDSDSDDDDEISEPAEVAGSFLKPKRPPKGSRLTAPSVKWTAFPPHAGTPRQEQIRSLLQEALTRWEAAGVDTSELGALNVRIVDFPDAALGMSFGRTVWLDADAGGYGWYIDGTPSDDSEFADLNSLEHPQEMDLLSVLMHEVGHLLGFRHADAGFMSGILLPGTRLTPDPAALPARTDGMVFEMQCGPDDGGPPPSPPPNKDSDSKKTKNAQSIDPNEKHGAAGYGPQAYIAAGTLIPYRIDFENLGPGSVPTPQQPATAPAQRVEVFDQLPDLLDWSTLRFTEIGFGDEIVPIVGDQQYAFLEVPMSYNDQEFVVEVELSTDPINGLVTVVFQSIDPNTFLPPDVLTGFLPPEDGTGRGKGHVGFTIYPRADLPSGTEIRNVALIAFDYQTLIATNQIDPQDPTAGIDPNREALNTIDAGFPTSVVETLPSTSKPTFEVRWNGSDEQRGSGIASYDIFVSTDDGPFVLWQQATTETSASFDGEVNHSYRFYSVATDNVGHREPAPDGFDTETTLARPLPWQNARNHFDVNDDDAVVPLDVLIVVNKLNRDGPGALPAIAEPPEYYYDVSGDNFVSPLDALQIINHLNGVLAMSEGDSNTIIQTNFAAGPAIDPAIAAHSAWWNFADLDDVSDDRFNRPSEVADRPELYGNVTSDNYVSPLKSRQTINDRNTRKLAGESLERMPDYPGLLGALSIESVDRVLADEQLWHLLWPDEDETDSLL
jgi:RHS repeat-associated protein